MAMIGPSWEIGYENQRTIKHGDVTLTDNGGVITQDIRMASLRAASAIGVEAAGMIRTQMESGYQDVHPVPRISKRTGLPLKPKKGTYPHTSIRDTSELIRDVQFDVSEEDGTVIVTVGNTLAYALFVHDGTRYLKKRPYIRDAIKKGWSRLTQIWEAYLAEAFNQ